MLYNEKICNERAIKFNSEPLLNIVTIEEEFFKDIFRPSILVWKQFLESFNI